MTRVGKRHTEVISTRWRLALGLSLIALVIAACSLSPLRLLGASSTEPPPAINLVRCDQAQDVLCLLTFGLEPPDEMVIIFLAIPGLPEKLEAVVTHNDETLPYSCKFTDATASVLYCTGPQVPLGSRLHIELRSTEPSTLLASGEFVLNALALPTLPSAGVGLPTALTGGAATPTGSPAATPRSTRTPFSATVNPNASPTRTPSSATAQPSPSPTRTPQPGTAYPNPP